MIYLKAFADTILGGMLLIILLGYGTIFLINLYFGQDSNFVFSTMNELDILLQIFISFCIGILLLFIMFVLKACVIKYKDEFNECLQKQKGKALQKSMDKKNPE